MSHVEFICNISKLNDLQSRTDILQVETSFDSGGLLGIETKGDSIICLNKEQVLDLIKVLQYAVVKTFDEEDD